MTAHVHDDGFHEIQLSGKQLVFFFMAATVVLVVVFLCGVLVGRGVRADRSAALADASTSAPIEPAAAPPAPVAPPAGADPTKAAPPAPSDDNLTYAKSLTGNGQNADALKVPAKTEKPAPAAVSLPAAKVPSPAEAKPAKEAPKETPIETPREAKVVPPPPADAPRAPAPAASTPAQAASTPAPNPAVAADAGREYMVQVAAVNVRSEADAIAKRLSSKGYDAYVMESAPGGAQMFRVRVGKFGTMREAQTMAAKLRREEQFKPWVTR